MFISAFPKSMVTLCFIIKFSPKMASVVDGHTTIMPVHICCHLARDPYVNVRILAVAYHQHSPAAVLFSAPSPLSDPGLLVPGILPHKGNWCSSVS